ncbi:MULTISPECIES: hypothetical protein [unclassified Streptomyces]|uniref:hypothetical protein n=1 Tax=unclassified Streptomyces TaxID=2593676 RepID=UPI00093A4D85|nr:hypothetical protein [Streptomyces sp. CB01580]OKJ37574.1 hypothetical protein AMK22_12740 [Streptomyces sp. CB01580]
MSDHLTDDVLACLARAGAVDTHHDRHLGECSDCRENLAVWQNITYAVRAEAEEAVPVPSFDDLLGVLPAVAPIGTAPHSPAVPDVPAVPSVPAVARSGRTPATARKRFAGRRSGSGTGPESAAPGAVPSGAPASADASVPMGTAGPARPWRTAWQLAVRQLVLMPRLWAPLSAIGLVAAALVSSAQMQERVGIRLFGAVVVLSVLFGALIVASPRRDPRRELLFTLPVSPAAVFLARLATVLCVDLALAMVCSALVRGPGWWAVVASWLGESLLAASLALALSVRFSPPAGAAAGGTLWFLGVVGGPHGLLSTPLDALLDGLLSTTPWTLAAAAALLVWAARAMRSFGEHAPS